MKRLKLLLDFIPGFVGYKDENRKSLLTFLIDSGKTQFALIILSFILLSIFAPESALEIILKILKYII